MAELYANTLMYFNARGVLIIGSAIILAADFTISVISTAYIQGADTYIVHVKFILLMCASRIMDMVLLTFSLIVTSCELYSIYLTKNYIH